MGIHVRVGSPLGSALDFGSRQRCPQTVRVIPGHASTHSVCPTPANSQAGQTTLGAPRLKPPGRTHRAAAQTTTNAATVPNLQASLRCSSSMVSPPCAHHTHGARDASSPRHPSCRGLPTAACCCSNLGCRQVNEKCASICAGLRLVAGAFAGRRLRESCSGQGMRDALLDRWRSLWDRCHARRRDAEGTWCSGITSASHAEGPGFKSQCVHYTRVGAGCLRPPMAGGARALQLALRRVRAGPATARRPAVSSCAASTDSGLLPPFKYSAPPDAAPAAPVESNAPEPVAMHHAASRRTASPLVKTRSMTRARTRRIKQRGASIAHPVLRANAILHPSWSRAVGRG